MLQIEGRGYYRPDSNVTVACSHLHWIWHWLARTRGTVHLTLRISASMRNNCFCRKKFSTMHFHTLGVTDPASHDFQVRIRISRNFRSKLPEDLYSDRIRILPHCPTHVNFGSGFTVNFGFTQQKFLIRIHNTLSNHIQNVTYHIGLAFNFNGFQRRQYQHLL